MTDVFGRKYYPVGKTRYIITYKYFYNFCMLEKHLIFIENDNSESLTLVLCSSLI